MFGHAIGQKFPIKYMVLSFCHIKINAHLKDSFILVIFFTEAMSQNRPVAEGGRCDISAELISVGLTRVN